MCTKTFYWYDCGCKGPVIMTTKSGFESHAKGQRDLADAMATRTTQSPSASARTVTAVERRSRVKSGGSEESICWVDSDDRMAKRIVEFGFVLLARGS